MRIKMRSQFVSKQFKIHNLKFKEVKTLQELTRPNIWKLKPYSSARDEYKGVTASVFLDANENPYNTPHNRYPDPMQCELKTLLPNIFFSETAVMKPSTWSFVLSVNRVKIM